MSTQSASGSDEGITSLSQPSTSELDEGIAVKIIFEVIHR